MLFWAGSSASTKWTWNRQAVSCLSQRAQGQACTLHRGLRCAVTLQAARHSAAEAFFHRGGCSAACAHCSAEKLETSRLVGVDALTPLITSTKHNAGYKMLCAWHAARGNCGGWLAV
mmetsp:Transcript_138432/g.386137  ORF Transcript_138432/g.386137 Transcript_138432/m.386137 type:complete len:117 (-) Transcript_138432:125-475(-)